MVYQRSSIYYHFISIFVPREVIQDSFEWLMWNPDSRYWLSDSLSNVGLRIPIVSGIPDSKVHDSEFQKQKFPGYRIPQEKVTGFWNRDYFKWAAIKQVNSKREVQRFPSTNCDRHFKILSQYFMEKKKPQ